MNTLGWKQFSTKHLWGRGGEGFPSRKFYVLETCFLKFIIQFGEGRSKKKKKKKKDHNNKIQHRHTLSMACAEIGSTGPITDSTGPAKGHSIASEGWDPGQARGFLQESGEVWGARGAQTWESPLACRPLPVALGQTWQPNAD